MARVENPKQVGYSSGMSAISKKLLQAAQELCSDVSRLKFSAPVTHVYNPLEYAWEPQRLYIEKYGATEKRVVIVGMNPGPFGMAQTGVPFGEISMVRDWMGIEARVGKPPKEHPKRPVDGFACKRSEVSGKRLWGAAAEVFGTPERFFKEYYVANYCPLVFMEMSGKNFTPDHLPAKERSALFEVCDRHLRSVVQTLDAEWVVGVGAFAAERSREALAGMKAVQIGQVLHPSPANPMANRGWAKMARAELQKLGVCGC